MPLILVVDDNQELLMLMARLLEDAGYQVVSANRGRAAIDGARFKPPALAVIDLLLPDMMGQQVAETLRRTNPKLPLIFVTGVFKAGRHALEARSKFGPVGYFEKPFDGQKLLEAVKKLVPLEKARARAPEDPFDVELDVSVEEDDPSHSTMELTGVIKVTGTDNLVAEIRGANLTASRVIPQAQPIARPAAVAPATSSHPAPAPPAASQRGELKDNLPSLITAFYLSGQTGELGVQRGKVKKVIYFHRGQPAFAMSNLLSERFGQFLSRVGKLKPEQLHEVLAAAQTSRRRTGDVLLERGLLKETERLYFVGQQVKSIIYSLFGWEQGAYVLTFKDKAIAEPIKLDVHPATLIVRGIKKFYKPERLRRLLAPEEMLIPSLQPSYQLHEVELQNWEAELLAKVDGTRSVAKLIELSGKAEPAVQSFLCAMMALQVLERRS
ncbi:MAG TPA: response regulator [Myxococcaceae bacterium]|nr:response regulator [Myxococcaceae bacterium]